MTPSLRFRGQPFRDEETAGAFLREVLIDPGITSLTAVVAWGRFGGLRRLEPEIVAFRERGGQLRVVLGIDEGGATLPGLTLAVRLADQPFVFHDRTARTFHPKMYLAQGPDKAILLVGSSNLTAGGLFSNYEASLEAEFELPGEEAAGALVGARGYIEMLLEDEHLCRPLDGGLIESLMEDPRYGISRGERRRRTSKASLPTGIEDGEADQHGEADGVGVGAFGPSRHGKTLAPPLSQEAREELDELEGEAGGETGPAPPVPPSTVDAPAAPIAGQPEVEETWTKVLPASDAQHPPSEKSNPLGNMRLTRSTHDIPWLTWFRHEMFGGEDWVEGRDRKRNPKETATVPFRVTIDGESHGLIDLEVDHASHREEEQLNHATVLHWGELAPVLRATDYTGCTVTIDRMSDGSYRLDISP